MAATEAALEDLVARARARRSLPPPERRRTIRRAAGISLAEVGNVVGVTGEAVRLWESGLRDPSPEFLPVYAELLARLAVEMS